jgi:putative membrane protein
MLRFLVALALVAAVVTPAGAQDRSMKAPRTNGFDAQVAAGNSFEIESSKLALERSKDEGVRALATMMVKDHTEATAKFKKAVAEAKVKAPSPRLDAKHKTALDTLKKETAGFDKAYVEAQHKAHVETVALFEAYASGGDNPRIKQFAQELLPTLRMHLEHVEKLRK